MRNWYPAVTLNSLESIVGIPLRAFAQYPTFMPPLPPNPGTVKLSIQIFVQQLDSKPDGGVMDVGNEALMQQVSSQPLSRSSSQMTSVAFQNHLIVDERWVDIRPAGIPEEHAAPIPDRKKYGFFEVSDLVRTWMGRSHAAEALFINIHTHIQNCTHLI